MFGVDHGQAMLCLVANSDRTETKLPPDHVLSLLFVVFCMQGIEYHVSIMAVIASGKCRGWGRKEWGRYREMSACV